jgi:hypothetical protein
MQWRLRRWGLVAQGLQLFKQKLHPYADELDELGVGAFVGFLALAVVDADVSDFGEVADQLAHLARQPGSVLESAGAQAIEKPLTPLRQCRGSRVDGLLFLGQQQLELHLGSFQGAGRVNIKLAQGRRGQGVGATFGKDLLQPILEAITDRGAQATARER